MGRAPRMRRPPDTLSPAGCTMRRSDKRFYHACVNVCRWTLRGSVINASASRQLRCS